MARDCTVKPDPNAPPSGAPQGMMSNKGNFDSEYASLMAELGESAGGGSTNKSWGGGGAGHDITAGGSNIPPWRRPEMWQSVTSTNQNQNQSGFRPQQQQQQGQYGSATSGYGAGYSGQSWQQPNYGQGYPQDYQAAYAQYYQSQYNDSQRH